MQLGVALQQAELLTQAQQQSAELQQAKEIADSANRAKTQFLAHMSHELRTPLNVILGFAQVLIRDASLTAKQQQNLETIARSGEHLLTLLNDVLEMSKIEAGQIVLNQHNFDLHRLLHSLVEMLKLKAESKGLEMILSYSSNLPQYIYADESKLRQILINLLGNAIKFTEKGYVLLHVSMESQPETQLEKQLKEEYSSSHSFIPDVIFFEVKDTGSGIAPDELDTLFKAFMQTETGRRSQEGTGLGLPISQQFVGLMGGEITVSSVVQQGSIFRFQIPLRSTQAIDVATLSSQSHRQVIGLQPHQPTYRVLVVDDKPESRMILVSLLVPLGFDVREAENGAEAVAIWESWEPHLIWMDMRMPVMDGYTATQQIRARPKGHETVIIALTATVFDQQRSVVIAAGCNDFVSKPLQETVLFEKMSEYMGVQYIYADRVNGSSEGSALKDLSGRDLSGGGSLTGDRLTVMPPEWIKQLHQAATQANEKQILYLIGLIPADQVSLANTLTYLVNEFQLETIINVIDAMP
jgi:signal transduction histidine kinase/CheY-like chemotaxis protein